jgi:hypothetical protein
MAVLSQVDFDAVFATEMSFSAEYESSAGITEEAAVFPSKCDGSCWWNTILPITLISLAVHVADNVSLH